MPRASLLVGMDEALKMTEKNRFNDKKTFSIFMWRPPQPVADVDTMQPALVYEDPCEPIDQGGEKIRKRYSGHEGQQDFAQEH